MSTTTKNLNYKRGDTRRIILTVKDSDGELVDISAWTAFVMTVDPSKAPANADNNVASVPGILVGGDDTGKVYFSKSGTVATGDYYYDVQATDANSEVVTLLEGRYKLTEDVTK